MQIEIGGKDTRPIVFRLLNEGEMEFLKKWFKRTFNCDLVKNILEGSKKQLLVGEGERKEIFLVPKNVFSVFKQISSVRMPFFLGLFLGELTKGDFKLSLEGAYVVAKKCKKKWIIVSDKGEILFLYGRDIMRGSIIKWDPSIRKGDRVVIMNRRGEALGVGRVVKGLKKAKNTDIVVKNLIDRGWYLRKGG